MFKRCFKTSTIIVLILFFIVSSAFAFPNLINYQGKLTDSSDVLLNGEYSLTFKIYSAETGGTPLWTEEQQVMVTNGIYNVELGAIQPLTQILFDEEKLYLEVIIFNIDTSADETLSPRIPFNATGFSMKAKDADSVSWSKITGMPASFVDDTDDVIDADADPGNEIQTLGISGNNITLSNGGGSIIAPYAINADMIDGKHASELGGGGDDHSLDAADGSPVDVVYVDNEGNVGIGTPSPGAILHIYNDNAAIPTFRIGNTLHGGLEFTQGSGDLFLGGANAQTGNFYVKDAQGNIRIAINSDSSSYFNNGNVGIGTASPNHKLEISGESMLLGTDTFPMLYLRDSHWWMGLLNASATPWGDSDSFVFNIDNSNRPFVFLRNGVNGTVEMIIKDGNVGIGTTEPQFPLSFKPEIGDKICLWGPTENGNHYGLGIQDRLLQIYTEMGGSDIAFGYGKSNDFTEKMRIKGNGNVGIGTASPAAGIGTSGGPYLEIEGGYPGMVLENTAYGGGRWLLYAGSCLGARTLYLREEIAGKYRLAVDEDGNLGIGTIDPSARLDVSGSATISGKVGIGTTSPSRKLDVAGNVIANAYEYHSDFQLKKNIASIDNALDRVLALCGVEFEWRIEEYPEKGFAEGRKIGLIAQDVEQVIPEVVSIDNEGYKSVEYGKIVSVLIEAIKAQQAQIEELKARIEILGQ